MLCRVVPVPLFVFGSAVLTVQGVTPPPLRVMCCFHVVPLFVFGSAINTAKVWTAASQLPAAFARLDAYVKRCDDAVAIVLGIVAFRTLDGVCVSGSKARMLQSLVVSVHSDFVAAITGFAAAASGKPVVWVDFEDSKASTWFPSSFGRLVANVSVVTSSQTNLSLVYGCLFDCNVCSVCGFDDCA